MTSRSISNIVLGFLLMLFNINLLNLNIYLPMIGVIFLEIGIWYSKELNANFKRAFLFGFIQCLLQVVGFLVSLTVLNSSFNIVTFILSIASLINMLLLAFYLFHGFKRVAQKNDLKPLASKATRCLTLYFAVVVLSCFGVITEGLDLPIIIVVVVIDIIFLGTLSQLGSLVPDKDCKNKKTKKVILVLTSGILTIVILSTIVLWLTNAPAIKSKAYNPNDYENIQQISDIKDKMTAQGFDQAVMNDLPSSEILKYQTIRGYHKKEQIYQLDGGELKIISNFSSLDNETVRMLEYFRWNKAPKHNYVDLLGLTINRDMLVMKDDYVIDSLLLYDKQEQSKTVTYQTEILKDPDSKDLAVKFRKLGNDVKNQRGYIAVDRLIAQPAEGLAFNTFISYTHQSSILNVPYKDIYSFYDRISAGDSDSFVFNTRNLVTCEDYKASK